MPFLCRSGVTEIGPSPYQSAEPSDIETADTATWPTISPSCSAASEIVSAPALRKASTMKCSVCAVCGASRNAQCPLTSPRANGSPRMRCSACCISGLTLAPIASSPSASRGVIEARQPLPTRSLNSSRIQSSRNERPSKVAPKSWSRVTMIASVRLDAAHSRIHSQWIQSPIESLNFRRGGQLSENRLRARARSCSNESSDCRRVCERRARNSLCRRW